MRAYEFLGQPVTRCVHFVQTHGSSESLEHEVAVARKRGVKCVYWSYLDGGRNSTTIADPLAVALGLEHAPYGSLPWIPFLDDLITLAYRYDGLVIVIDRADLLITERRDDMFNCLEAFLHQFHHWYDQKKPCHLCFQMVQDDFVTELFSREGATQSLANEWMPAGGTESPYGLSKNVVAKTQTHHVMYGRPPLGMYGRPPLGKGFLMFGKRIGERSCIRPRDAAFDRGP